MDLDYFVILTILSLLYIRNGLQVDSSSRNENVTSDHPFGFPVPPGCLEIYSSCSLQRRFFRRNWTMHSVGCCYSKGVNRKIVCRYKSEYQGEHKLHLKGNWYEPFCLHRYPKYNAWDPDPPQNYLQHF